jgi:hypothetical protein
MALLPQCIAASIIFLAAQFISYGCIFVGH